MHDRCSGLTRIGQLDEGFLIFDGDAPTRRWGGVRAKAECENALTCRFRHMYPTGFLFGLGWTRPWKSTSKEQIKRTKVTRCNILKHG